MSWKISAKPIMTGSMAAIRKGGGLEIMEAMISLVFIEDSRAQKVL